MSIVGTACDSDDPGNSAADTGFDADTDTTEQEDICWSETSVCTLECGEGSHCVVPGICAPLDDPGWRPEDYRDPRERDDLRSLLAEDGSFRGPVGLIDDMRFPQGGLGLLNYIDVYNSFPEFDWFNDYGPHSNYELLPDVAERLPSIEDNTPDSHFWPFGISWFDYAYLHWVRRGLVPALVLEQADENQLTYRLWQGEVVLRANQGLAQALDESDAVPLDVRPRLSESGLPVLLGEWTFEVADSDYSNPASAVLLLDQSVVKTIWRASFIEDLLPGRTRGFPLHSSTISQGLSVIDGSLRSTNQMFPAQREYYMYRSEPPLSPWDVRDSFATAPVSTFVLSGLVSIDEIARNNVLFAGSVDCICVRPPDSIRLEDEQRTALPIWNNPENDPFAGCSDATRAEQCRLAASIGVSTHYPVQGFYAGCEPESRYVSFVRFTRVAPAVSLPARGWVPDEGAGEGAGM